MNKLKYLFLITIIILCCGCEVNSITAPSFSSNDAYIIFGGGAFNRGIYRVNKDGSGLKRLVAGVFGCEDRAPALSSDDKRLVFSRKIKDGFEHLYLVDLTSSRIVQVTSGDTYDRSPIFSPDNKKIYFLRFTKVPHLYPSTSAIYSLDVDSFTLQKITADADVGVLERISISPDYNTVAVGYVAPVLSMISLDGKNTGTIEFFDEVFDQPAYSQDGNFIVFIGRVTQGFNYSARDIYVMDLQSKKPKKIATIYDHSVAWPSFSHSGNEITVCSGPPYVTNKLWIMNKDGSDIRKVNINF